MRSNRSVIRRPLAVAAVVTAAAALSACATADRFQTYDSGDAYGCQSGYADANWPGATYFPIPADASEGFKQGWNEGYKRCLEYGQNFPRAYPGGPGGGR